MGRSPQKPHEHELARAWRESQQLTRQALAEQIGYSISVIQDFELGRIRGTGKPIGENEWKRYRLACAAVDARLEFYWGQK